MRKEISLEDSINCMHLLLRQFFAEMYAETSIDEVMSLTSDIYVVSNSSEVFRCTGHCAGAIMC
jgi:hypothetical protein